MKIKPLTRIIAVLLAAVSAAALAGCGASAIAFDQKKPWDMPSVYEYAEYKAEKFQLNAEDKTYVQGDKVSEGRLVFVLKKDSYGETDCLKLTADCTLTNISDKAPAPDTVMHSEVYFYPSTLMPIYSEKRLEVAGDSADNPSYIVKTDYAAGQSTLSYFKRAEEERTLKLKLSGQVFDNEQLFFAVRAFSSLAAGRSQSFSMYNALDSFLSGKPRVYTMGMNVSSASLVALKDWKNEKSYGLTVGETLKVPQLTCYVATIGINEQKSGTSITAYYGTESFKVGQYIETKKVLCGLETTEYDSSLSAPYSTIYSLIDYHAADDVVQE